MPVRHGLEVSILHASDRTEFVEYGTKSLNSCKAKSKIVSTQIEARNGEGFYIRIKPVTPFPFEPDENSDTLYFRDPMKKLSHGYNLRYQPADYFQPVEEQDDKPVNNNQTSVDEAAERKEDVKARVCTHMKRGQRGRSKSDSALGGPKTKPMHSAKPGVAKGLEMEALVPPFDLSACVFIDGHEKPECRQIIYLDPENPKWSRSGYVLRGRWVSIADEGKVNKQREEKPLSPNIARVEVQNWVFTSVGIDLLLSRLNLDTADSQPPKSGMDREVRELEDMMNQNSLSITERPKPGQIEVQIARICIGEESKKQCFRPHLYAGNGLIKPLTVTEDPNCTHVMSLLAGSEQNIKTTSYSWKYYKKNEEVYARFLFQYMGREKLVNLGLSQEDGTPIMDDDISGSMDVTATSLKGKRRATDAAESFNATKKKFDARLQSRSLEGRSDASDNERNDRS